MGGAPLAKSRNCYGCLWTILTGDSLARVCVIFLGQSRSLFGVGRSLVSMEIGEASLISSFFPLGFLFLT